MDRLDDGSSWKDYQAEEYDRKTELSQLTEEEFQSFRGATPTKAYIRSKFARFIEKILSIEDEF